MSEINFFAETNFRNIRKKFGIKTDDRRRHVYVVGKTGMGKSALLENMAIQDIQDGKGLAFVDPHGEAAEDLLNFIPESRIKDVVYFNPADLNYPIAFNIMEQVDIEKRHLVSGGLMGVFKKIWPDVWSARMEYILNNCILALLEYPEATLLGVNRMLADPDYRAKVIEKVTDPVVKAYWTQEFAGYDQRYASEATAAIQNKIGQFTSAPLIRNIIGQTHSSLNMREIMDGQKILILNLSKGKVGEDASRLLGALLITKLQLAAMSRVDIPEADRKDFYLYVDEFQNFATESFVNILSEARKYRLALILGHQYINQMEETVRDAVFGNIGTLISFRVGAEDAEFIEKEFMPEFLATDLVNLAKYNIYLKLMIDGLAGRPFSAETLPPLEELKDSNVEKIIEFSRKKYSVPRAEVEDKIIEWAESINANSSSQPGQKFQSMALFDAQCSTCGKIIKVPFKPDPRRPVYCKSCKEKIGASVNPAKEKDEAPPAPATEPVAQEKSGFASLRDAILEKETTDFNPSKKDPGKKQKKRKEIDIDGLKQILDEPEGNEEKSESDDDGFKPIEKDK
jgi:CxxC-x17-CxxC domain-containing protein